MKKGKIFWIFVLCIVAFFVLKRCVRDEADVEQDAKHTATVTDNYIFLHSAPGISAPIINRFQKGDVLTAIGNEAYGWLPVEYEDGDTTYNGYVRAEFVKQRGAKKSTSSEQLPTITVTTNSLTLHRTRSAAAVHVVKEVHKGDVLTITGEACYDFLPVEHEGTNGYVNVRFITQDPLNIDHLIANFKFTEEDDDDDDDEPIVSTRKKEKSILDKIMERKQRY